MATRVMVVVVVSVLVLAMVATANGGFHLFLAHAPDLLPGPKVRTASLSAFRFPLVACRLSNQFVRNH